MPEISFAAVGSSPKSCAIKLISILSILGVTVHESWSPLACGQNGFFRNQVLKELGEKYGKSNAQVGLRFLYQQGIVIIPKSTHIERMKENMDILDFELTAEEMNEITRLDFDRSMFGWW